MFGTVVSLLVMLVATGLVVAVFYGLSSALDAAKEYRRCLDDLRADPHNPDLRQKALRLGRQAAVVNRKLFDEAKLMNDINAACARAGEEVVVKGKALGREETETSIESRLEKLNDLKSRELVTEAEYRERRQEILREI